VTDSRIYVSVASVDSSMVTLSLPRPDVLEVDLTLRTPKVGKCRKGLTNPGSGGKGWNFIIPFVRQQWIMPYSVLFRPSPP
jgi:hypothetical protein